MFDMKLHLCYKMYLKVVTRVTYGFGIIQHCATRANEGGRRCRDRFGLRSRGAHDACTPARSREWTASHALRQAANWRPRMGQPFSSQWNGKTSAGTKIWCPCPAVPGVRAGNAERFPKRCLPVPPSCIAAARP